MSTGGDGGARAVVGYDVPGRRHEAGTQVQPDAAGRRLPAGDAAGFARDCRRLQEPARDGRHGQETSAVPSCGSVAAEKRGRRCRRYR